MTRKQRLKLKIKTKNKSYSLVDCALYKITSKRRLANLLGLNIGSLMALSSGPGRYEEFDEVSPNGKSRRIQKPIRALDIVHTRIASLLCRVATPDYLHSGKKHHSNVSNAQAHVGAVPLLTTDIRSFFPSTKRSAVFSFFYKQMSCVADVADLLANLCTIHDHIPTGSRISMPMAYFANKRMFDELNRLSIKHRVKMTVYVDDVTFSGIEVNRLFRTTVHKVVSRYGHEIHPTKTRLYSRDSPKLVTGVVVAGNELKVRNKQHHNMFSELAQWCAVKNEPGIGEFSITKQLIGRLYSMSVVEGHYRDKVRTVIASCSG